MSKSTRTARKSSKPESGTGYLTTPRSGPIYLPSTVANAEAWWTSLREGSRASRTPSPDSGAERLTNAISGPTPSESLAKWDPVSCCWRTCQVSLFPTTEGQVTLEPLSGSFPNSVTWDEQGLYPLPPLVPRTSVGAGGALPTPQVVDREQSNANTMRWGGQNSLSAMAKTGLWPTPSASQARSEGMIVQMRVLVDQGKVTVAEAEAMIGGSLNPARMGFWPTPAAHPAGWKNIEVVDKDGNPPAHFNQRLYHKETGRLVEKGLEQAVTMWLTPKGSPEHYGQPRENDRGDLQAAAMTWPTPTAITDTGGAALCKWGGAGARAKLRTIVSDQELNGALNPGFVEWLQGVPEGWTDLAPLPAKSWQRWQQGGHWATGEWEGVPRVATGVKDRVGRLRALGNGIVPMCLSLFLRGK